MKTLQKLHIKHWMILLAVLLFAAACSGAAEPEVVEVEVTRVVTETIVETVIEEVDGETVEVEVTRVIEVEVPIEAEVMEDATPVTFTGWSLNEGASRDTIMAFVADYEAQNNVDISDVAVPWGETLNQLVLQTSGNTAEGAAQLDIAWLTTLAATGALKDLSAYADGRGYTDAALSSGQVNGVQYGLPWTTGSIGMVANQQILDDAGITELPTTIAEFEAALEQIKAYDPEIIPYAGMTNIGGLKDVIPWIWTFGGEVIDANGNVVVGDAGSVAALEWYKSLLDRGLIASEMDRFTARQLFSQGKTAFYDDAIVVKGIVTKETPIENLADLIVSVPRPVVNAGDASQSLLWGHIVVVFDGENSDAAAAWAQHLTSDPDTIMTYFDQLSLPPTTAGGLGSSVVKEDAFISAWSNNVTATSRTNPFWPYAESARMEAILDEQIQAYLVGSIATAQEALEMANEQIRELMD